VTISQNQVRWTNGVILIAQSIALLKAGHRGIQVALAMIQVMGNTYSAKFAIY